MNQKDHSIIKISNINSDIIVVNQSNENKVEEFEYRNHTVKFISFNERGVGLSRNTALMRADADIVLFADDDMEYINDYENIILNAFKDNKKADAILFNVESTGGDRSNTQHKSNGRIRKWNSLKYGAVNIAIRLDSVQKKRLSFSLLFGGGAPYSAGEDSLFIFDCLNSGLRLYRNSTSIGRTDYSESTWFSGYNAKFFKDRGVLFGALSRHFSSLLILQFITRKLPAIKTNLKTLDVYRLMMDGAKEYKKTTKVHE